MQRVDTSETYQYDHLLKLVVLGDRNAGKTCFIDRFHKQEYHPSFSQRTGLECYFNTTVKIKNAHVKIQLWDIAQEENNYYTLEKGMMRGAHGYIALFDISDWDSFEKVKKIINTFPEGENIILVGAKSDLSSRRQIDSQTAETFAAQKHISYLEVSSKENKNVDETIYNFSLKILERDKKFCDERKREESKTEFARTFLSKHGLPIRFSSQELSQFQSTLNQEIKQLETDYPVGSKVGFLDSRRIHRVLTENKSRIAAAKYELDILNASHIENIPLKKSIESTNARVSGLDDSYKLLQQKLVDRYSLSQDYLFDFIELHNKDSKENYFDNLLKDAKLCLEEEIEKQFVSTTQYDDLRSTKRNRDRVDRSLKSSDYKKIFEERIRYLKKINKNLENVSEFFSGELTRKKDAYIRKNLFEMNKLKTDWNQLEQVPYTTIETQLFRIIEAIKFYQNGTSALSDRDLLRKYKGFELDLIYISHKLYHLYNGEENVQIVKSANQYWGIVTAKILELEEILNKESKAEKNKSHLPSVPPAQLKSSMLGSISALVKQGGENVLSLLKPSAQLIPSTTEPVITKDSTAVVMTQTPLAPFILDPRTAEQREKSLDKLAPKKSLETPATEPFKALLPETVSNQVVIDQPQGDKRLAVIDVVRKNRNAYSKALLPYLEGLMKEPSFEQQIADLNLDEKEREFFAKFTDSITNNYMNLPVTIHGDPLDLSTALKLREKVNNLNPNRQLEYELSDISVTYPLVTEMREAIKNEKNRQEAAKEVSPQSTVGSGDRLLSSQSLLTVSSGAAAKNVAPSAKEKQNANAQQASSRKIVITN